MTNQTIPTQTFTVSTREEAELLLEHLTIILNRDKVVFLEDLHNLLGEPTTYIHIKWGWTQLNDAAIKQVDNGYLLDLPPMEEI